MRPFELNSKEEGKDWITKFLQKRGFDVTDTDTISQYSHYDICAEKDGNTIWMELKNRDIYSFTYGDIEINQDKYDFLMNSPYKTILVYFFMDKWCMVDVKNIPPTEIYEKMAQHSYRWNRQKEMKKFVRWNIDGKKIRLLNYDKV